MERSGRDRSKKVAAVEAGLKQAAEKRRKINIKKKKMKTAEFSAAPVTTVLDHTTLPPMVTMCLNFQVLDMHLGT